MCVHITGGGVDYDSGPYTVTFPAGQTSVSFDSHINNDNILEASEDFTLTINSSSLPDGATVGNPSSATVTIVNDDGKVMLGSASYQSWLSKISKSLVTCDILCSSSFMYIIISPYGQ